MAGLETLGTEVEQVTKEAGQASIQTACALSSAQMSTEIATSIEDLLYHDKER